MSSSATPQLLQTLRARYGLSQAQLAEYLAVSRAQVSMAEQGRRVLPAAMWEKLRPLVEVLSAPTAATTAPLLDEASREALQRRLRECTHEATRLRQELVQLRSKAAQHQALIHELVPRLLPLVTAQGDHQAQRWLELRHEESRQELNRSGPAAQILLELRIEALDYEASQAALRLARASHLPI